MPAHFFDTHKAVKNLKAAGFNETQAEAIVAAISAAVAGKIAAKEDGSVSHNKPSHEVQDSIADVKEDAGEVRNEPSPVVQDLIAELKAIERRLTLRIGGMLFVLFAVIGLSKFL